MTAPGNAVTSPARLAEVLRSGLLDTAAEEPFDRLTRLACELLGTPLGFVTVVDESRSFWKSCFGDTGGARQNPVGESFCQYVIDTDGAVVIDDARLDAMTRENPSIDSMGVIAWAGYPVRAPNGQVLGSFCVVDTRPRRWSERDRRTLETLARAAGGEVALRLAAEEATAHAQRYRQLALTFQESLLPRDLPAVDGLDLAAAYRLRADDVLGDFYDAVQTPTGWAIFLGEVAGDGAHAARTSALAKYTLRAAAVRATSPAIVLTELHAALRRWFDETGTPGSAAVAYVSLRRTGAGFAVRVTTAGHPPALLRRADGTVRRLGQPGDPIGLRDRVVLKVDDADLLPGDSLLVFGAAVERRLAATGFANAAAGDAGAAGTAAALVTGADPDDDGDLVALALHVLQGS